MSKNCGESEKSSHGELVNDFITLQFNIVKMYAPYHLELPLLRLRRQIFFKTSFHWKL